MAEELFLKDEFALFVFLAALVRLVVLPPHSLFALSAGDVTNYMSTGSHAALDSLRLGDVDDVVEEVGFAMLAAEVLDDTRRLATVEREERTTMNVRLTRLMISL